MPGMTGTELGVHLIASGLEHYGPNKRRGIFLAIATIVGMLKLRSMSGPEDSEGDKLCMSGICKLGLQLGAKIFGTFGTKGRDTAFRQIRDAVVKLHPELLGQYAEAERLVHEKAT